MPTHQEKKIDLYKPVSMFDHVVEMHQKFKIPPAFDDCGHEDVTHLMFRAVAMQEELVEFQRAVIGADRVNQLDALVDLCVFLFGTADVLGFSAEDFTKAFHRVMTANMNKALAGRSSNSKRRWAADLIKPEGWEPANLEDLV